MRRFLACAVVVVASAAITAQSDAVPAARSTGLDPRKDIARKDGVLLIGQTAFAQGAWRIPENSPDFTQEVIESAATKSAIDPRRVYLFGHSGGAGHALLLSAFGSRLSAFSSRLGCELLNPTGSSYSRSTSSVASAQKRRQFWHVGHRHCPCVPPHYGARSHEASVLPDR